MRRRRTDRIRLGSPRGTARSGCERLFLLGEGMLSVMSTDLPPLVVASKCKHKASPNWRTAGYGVCSPSESESSLCLARGAAMAGHRKVSASSAYRRRFASKWSQQWAQCLLPGLLPSFSSGTGMRSHSPAQTASHCCYTILTVFRACR